MQDVRGISAVAERRVHEDAVVAATNAAPLNPRQLGEVELATLPAILADQANPIRSHAALSAQDAASPVRRLHQVAEREPSLCVVGVVEVQEVAPDDVEALGLQQLAPVVGHLDDFRLSASGADLVGNVPHARARLQNAHSRLKVGGGDHLVGHALRRREEVQAVIAPANHGALKNLDLVGFGSLLAQAYELAQRGAELGRRLDAHALKLLAALIGALKLPRHRNLGAATVGPAHALHQLGAELVAQRDALVAVASP